MPIVAHDPQVWRKDARRLGGDAAPTIPGPDRPRHWRFLGQWDVALASAGGTLDSVVHQFGGFAVSFKIGSKVVYPSHGVAEIVGRETRVIDGKKHRYLVLFVPQHGWGTLGGMRVLLPEDQAEAVGVRPAISQDDASEVLDLLAVTDARVPSNWSRRFKNHQEKLKSGDVYECAEVVRNLARRKRDAALSAAETVMYAKARHTLVAELAVSWGTDEAEAGERVDGALGLPPEDAPVWRPADQLS